ncbi:hypothetical protein OSB04_020145 [Centaurea solstitialis]|uniref:Uncharacterized protein n=1 Tax=Centaurea solstitialis TaxID=347529 RepID=A0AA38TA38_9ASTR|nr:hypothetical protein OSB04_020145 [Centaurea solstitialis]
MSGSRGFAVSRSDTDDRFCNHQNVDRHHDQLLHNQLLRGRNNNHMAVADADNRTDADDFNATLHIPPLMTLSYLPCALKPPTGITNLESFLDSVTPIVPAQKSSEKASKPESNSEALNQKARSSESESFRTNGEAGVHPYYCLGDLWETFREWSAYGAGVPLLLHGRYPTTQYYVPFLSGMQLYVDPQKPERKLRCRGEENGGGKIVWGVQNLAEVCAFEYMEQEHPHSRPPLADKVSSLASEFPELSKYRSCDLSVSSWLCVAWYPIYRIPVGPTLKDLEASFLTFHSLSTQPGCTYLSLSFFHFKSFFLLFLILYVCAYIHTHTGYGEAGFSSMSENDGICLPIIGMASYKLKGSIISPYSLQECDQENSLLEAATNWLHHLQALLPDYQFFLARYS